MGWGAAGKPLSWAGAGCGLRFEAGLAAFPCPRALPRVAGQGGGPQGFGTSQTCHRSGRGSPGYVRTRTVDRDSDKLKEQIVFGELKLFLKRSSRRGTVVNESD